MEFLLPQMGSLVRTPLYIVFNKEHTLGNGLPERARKVVRMQGKGISARKLRDTPHNLTVKSLRLSEMSAE